MASLQKKGDSWYCQFMFQRQRHTYTVGKVEETEAKATAAKIDYILMRVRQRLLELPLGMDIIAFIEHDGNPPAEAQPALKNTPFSELRKTYLETFSHGALESNTLYTAKIHLNHLGKTLGEQFPLNTLGLSHLQKHVDRRQKEVSGVTIKKEIDTLRAAWNWAIRMGLTHGVFPNGGLVYPKGDDKLPFMTSEEIERRIKAGGDPDELWECLYLTHSEIDELLDHVKERKISPWIYPAFVLTAHTGARQSEMMRATPEDVDLVGVAITIREKKRVRGRRTTRRVPFSGRAVEVLTGWMRKSRRTSLLVQSRSEHVGAPGCTVGIRKGGEKLQMEGDARLARLAAQFHLGAGEQGG